MRLRIPACFFAVVLAALVLPPVASPQPRATEPGEDFPLEDHSVWLFVERGLKNQAADLQLARAPESPETVALLLDAHRPGDALEVLRRIVERRPDRMGAAFKAASTNAHDLFDDGRGYRSALREIVATARQRLRELPREQAAEAAWYVRSVALPAPGETPVPTGVIVAQIAATVLFTAVAYVVQRQAAGIASAKAAFPAEQYLAVRLEMDRDGLTEERAGTVDESSLPTEGFAGQQGAGAVV